MTRINSTPKWYFEGINPVNENTTNDNLLDSKWCIAARYFMLIALLFYYIYISVWEYQLYEPWGQITIGFVNGFSFLATLFLCITANRYDRFEEKKTFWRLYYNWLHFLVAVITPLIGFLILCSVQNLLTLILEGTLVGLLILLDFGTLEDIIEKS